MRYLGTAVVALTLCGCAESKVDSTAPAPSASKNAIVWGMVLDASGACIPGAVALVVAGQGAGQSRTQVTPCAAWDLEGGFVLKDLTAGVELTVQASAPGYATLQKTVVPSDGAMGAIEVLAFTLGKQ
jgi:hypothetical protein